MKAGDIIISGLVTYEDEEGNEISPAGLIHAKGIVNGIVWYTAKGYVGMTVAESEATGNIAESLSLNLMGKEDLLWGTKQFDYAGY